MKNIRIIKAVFIPSVIAFLIWADCGPDWLGIVGAIGMFAGIETKDENGITW